MRRPTATLVAALLTVSLGTAGCGAGIPVLPATGAVLGNVLTDLLGKVDGVVSHVDNAVEGNVMEAAATVRYTIDNAVSAWSTELDKHVSQLDTNVTASLNKLSVVVADLSSAQRNVIAQATADAQTIANTLPFANRAPQVKGYTPRLHPADGKPVQVTVTGNFPQVQTRAPALKAGDRTLNPTSATTGEITFEVPPDLLATPGAGGLTARSFDLHIPYEEGVVFTKLRPGTFRLLLSAVPISPVVSLTVTDTVLTNSNHREPLVSPPYEVNALKDGDVKNKRYGVTARAGWRIDPQSARIVIDTIKNEKRIVGPTWVTRTESDLITETTAHKCRVGPFGSCGSGRVRFHSDLRFAVQRIRRVHVAGQPVPVRPVQEAGIDTTRSHRCIQHNIES